MGNLIRGSSALHRARPWVGWVVVVVGRVGVEKDIWLFAELKLFPVYCKRLDTEER